MKRIIPLILAIVIVSSCHQDSIPLIHVNEVKEIVLLAEEDYDNPYADALCWLELSGPGINKKIYGFWNGDNEFIVRVVATQPGEWKWQSFSDPVDPGLSNQSGALRAVAWKTSELSENVNRRGFIKPTENGHALEYADGTPFFMLGDAWWAASTWRYPFTGIEPDENYIPDEGISFEEAIAYRKKQGYNTIAMIASFPNWKVDDHPSQYMNEDSVGIRSAWGKNGMNTAKDMHDEAGNMPFEPWTESDIIPD